MSQYRRLHNMASGNPKPGIRARAAGVPATAIAARLLRLGRPFRWPPRRFVVLRPRARWLLAIWVYEQGVNQTTLVRAFIAKRHNPDKTGVWLDRGQARSFHKTIPASPEMRVFCDTRQSYTNRVDLSFTEGRTETRRKTRQPTPIRELGQSRSSKS